MKGNSGTFCCIWGFIAFLALDAHPWVAVAAYVNSALWLFVWLREREQRQED